MDPEVLKPILAGIVRHAITAAAGTLVAHGAMQSSQTEQFVGAGMFLAGVAWSWWQKQGQAQVGDLLKKLTSRSTVEAAKATAEVAKPGAAVKAMIIFALIALALRAAPTFAADLPIALPFKTPAATPCTVTSCSGFYLGGNVTTAGTDLAVLSTGLNGVLTSQGSSFGVIGGWQYWNNGLFAGVEVFANYVQNPPQVNGLGVQSHFLTGELFKLGGNLGGLFGSSPGTTSPTQGISLNLPGFHLVSPFVLAGAAQRGSRNGTATGVGAEFIVGPNFNAIAQLIHADYNGGQPATTGANLKTEDLVMFALVRKW